ncbi:UDP-Glycosyltransferase/glycogen phosphorylase [Lyophyllum atratum]|nr:UDP-Glycosyltransferase/glycogen phosphorylase [Lyophyllum atratum]
MTSSSLSHLLLVSFPAWGHLRPLCVLAARLVSEREDILVTILAAPSMLEKSRSEIARQFKNGSPALQRIRLISLFQSTDSDMMVAVGLFTKSYPAAYETLAQAKPMTCPTTGASFDAAPAPVAVILDFFLIHELKATRALSGRSVPIISWMTGGGSTLIRCWGPESMGGRGDFAAKVQAEAARTNESLAEVGEKLYRHTDGSVVKLPGVPAMYDHEFSPQKACLDLFLADSDAMMITSADAYEKESLDAVRAWFAEMQKPVYVVGPLLPAGYTSTQSDVNQGNANVEMSFGTVFWPTKSEYIEEVIEALLEKEIPFILSHASPFAKVPVELSDKVQSSGLGLSTTWSPQQFILTHPATGWFLTHGGHGGITESLGSGIPLICWPFDADQPAAAAHLTLNLKAAFELIEVRTGLGLKPLHRLNGEAPKGTREAVGVEIRRVLEACRGQEGEELRKNAERVKGQFAEAWEEGGPAKAALGEFLKRYA